MDYSSAFTQTGSEEMIETSRIFAGPGGFARRITATALAALLAVGVSAGCASDKPDAADRAAIEGMKSDIDALRAQTRDDPGARINPFDVGPVPEDEAGRMHQVMRQYLNMVVKARNDYLSELDDIGWNDVLDPDRLQADADMTESRRLSGQARDAMARAETNSVAALAALPGLIEAAPLSAANKRDMLKGYRRSSERGLADMRGSFALESQTLDQFEGMVELLDRVEWGVEESQIVFYSDADVETFNGYFNRINTLSAELEARQKAGLDRARETLSRSGY